MREKWESVCHLFRNVSEFISRCILVYIHVVTGVLCSALVPCARGSVINFSSLENLLSPGKPQPQNSGQTNTESCAAFTCSSDGPIFLEPGSVRVRHF